MTKKGVNKMESIIAKLSCDGDCYLGFKTMSVKCATQCSCCKIKRITNTKDNNSREGDE